MFTDGRITSRIRTVHQIWQQSLKLVAATVFLTGTLPLGLNDSKLLLSNTLPALKTSANIVQERFCVHQYLSVCSQDISNISGVI